MRVLNYSHPLTDEQRAQLEALVGQPIGEVRQISAHFDQQAEFGPQLEALIQAAGLSPAAPRCRQASASPSSAMASSSSPASRKSSTFQ